MFQYQVQMQRVVDGDTYRIDIDLGFSIWVKNETIRLYGVNTPEVYGVKKESEEYAMGKKASDFAKSLIKKGDWGIVETLKDDKGKYGRYLAVLYIKVDADIVEGMENIRAIGNFYCLNDILLARGLAEPYYL